jgi:type IV secretory pathway TrbL component
MQGDSNVIPAGIEPGIGSMALVTGIKRHISAAVVRRFANALAAVMADSALTWQGGSVIKASTQEGGGIKVTRVARRIGHDMIGGFRHGHDAFTQSMAAIATPWGAFEYATKVTCLAS